MIIRHPRWRRLARTTAQAGAVFCAAVLGATIWVSSESAITPASATPVVGAAQIVNPTGGAQLNSGGRDTDFTFSLPSGAGCAGDSTNDNFRVYGYMVAEGIDPASLTFNSNGPTDPSFGTAASLRAPLYDTGGTPYAGASTADRAAPGQPGLIINIPVLDHMTLAPVSELPSGTYNVGVACWGPLTAPALDRFWNTKMTITTAAEPPSAAWAVAQAAATTTVLSVTPASPAAVGAPVTLAAAVTPSTAAGTVTFKRGETVIGSPVAVVSGAATLTRSDLAAGSTNLTAVFTPADAGAFAPSTSNVVAYVIGIPSTTTALIASPAGKAAVGAPVTMTATVTPSDAAGTVTFKRGDAAIGTPIAVTAGVATLTRSDLAVGSASLTATFTPTNPSAHGPSTSAPVVYQIGAVTTTTALAVTPTGQAPAGATVTLTATITPSAVAGTVTFKRGDTTIGSPVAVAGGTATTTTAVLPTGNASLTAVFTPTEPAAFAASTSPAVSYVIGSGTTTTSSPSTTTRSSPSTTTTTRPGATTTTVASGPTTTARPASAVGGTSATTGGSGGALARTGTTLRILLWAALLVILGRISVLLGRTPDVVAGPQE